MRKSICASKLIQIIYVLFILSVLSACGGGGGGGTGNIYIDQTGSAIDKVTSQTIMLNNCGGQSEITETAERTLDISVDGGLGVQIKVVEANLRAKYARGQKTSIELPAAPGTNMEYTLEWTEEAFFGEITTDDQTGKAEYRVLVPTVQIRDSVDLGCITGDYFLVAWNEAPSPITLYMDVDSGSLTINPSGDVTWTLAIRERGEYPSPQPAVTCKGRLSGTQLIEGGPGGNAADWTFDMSGFAHDIWMAYCGWDVGGDSDPFTLFPKELGGGNRSLEMKNSRGTLIWEK